MAAERPFLVLPPAARVPTAIPPAPRGGGPRNPGKARQIQRLDPQFLALQAALDERRMSLEASPAGVAPEQVVVFETNGAVGTFVETVRQAEGFSWLAEDELVDLVQD